MKLIFRIAQPKDSRERLFRLECDVNDMKTPGEALVTIGGKEYEVEVQFDRI